jgi:hypothetical protein
MAAITNYEILGGLKQKIYSLIVLEYGSMKLKYQQEVLRITFPCLFQVPMTVSSF